MAADSGGGGGVIGSVVSTIRSWVDWFGGGRTRGQIVPYVRPPDPVGDSSFSRLRGSYVDSARPVVSVPRIPVAVAYDGGLFGLAAAVPAPRRNPRRRPRRRTTRPRRPPARPQRPERAPAPRTAPAVEPPSAPPVRPPIKIPVRIPSIPGTLTDLWWKLIEEYTAPRPSKPTPGGQRRRGPRTRQPKAPSFPTLPAPGPIPVDIPRPKPRSQPGEIFDAPIPAQDPFSRDAFPAAQLPRASSPRRAAAPRRASLLGVSPLLQGALSLGTKSSPRYPRRDRRSSPRRQEDIPRRQEQQPTNQLTALQRGQLDLPPSIESNPCAQAAREKRRQQRRRRKECTKFVTKEIRVCQSFKEK